MITNVEQKTKQTWSNFFYKRMLPLDKSIVKEACSDSINRMTENKSYEMLSLIADTKSLFEIYKKESIFSWS